MFEQKKLEKAINDLERCVMPHSNGCTQECEYHGRIECCRQVMRNAIAILKAQEPRLITREDFGTDLADAYGYIPVWTEKKERRLVL